jgi:F0F1-type ATP synthase assembly protein I
VIVVSQRKSNGESPVPGILAAVILYLAAAAGIVQLILHGQIVDRLAEVGPWLIGLGVFTVVVLLVVATVVLVRTIRLARFVEEEAEEAVAAEHARDRS